MMVSVLPLSNSQKELQNLEDASGDIMLLDDDQCIPYPPHYNIHLDPGLTCSNNDRLFRLYYEELSNQCTQVLSKKSFYGCLRLQWILLSDVSPHGVLDELNRCHL